MSIEHRQSRRYAIELAAEVDIGGDVLVASTQNVSVGGVGLVVDREIPEGTRCGVTLFLTQDGIEDPDEAPFEARAVVAWQAERDTGTWLVGVRFAEVSPAGRAHLERFVSKLPT